MNRMMFIASIFFLGITLGAATNSLLHPQTSTAQAKPKAFKECAGVTAWVYKARQINEGRDLEKLLKIPEGWTPIGGAVTGKYGGVILCR